MKKLAAAALAAASVIALTGCSAVSDLMYNQTGSHFDTAADLAEGWGKSAPWVPSDATEIRITEATSGDPAVLLAMSGHELDPAVCAETERQSSPTYFEDWSPDAYAADTVFACGAWTVMRIDGGWYGWTPSDPDEEAASPSVG